MYHIFNFPASRDYVYFRWAEEYHSLLIYIRQTVKNGAVIRNYFFRYQSKQSDLKQRIEKILNKKTKIGLGRAGVLVRSSLRGVVWRGHIKIKTP